MLKRTFDLKLPYKVVVYLRMSSDKQNERSPDQQLAEIKRRMKTLGLPWRIVRVYRDDAQSGRYFRKRAQFMQMLQDIKLGRVQVDLIVVDTMQRFGRLEELDSIRRGLLRKSGVLIVTADSNFADPTTPQGKALGAFESLQATEENRIKAHNVLRGKRDAVEQKHWPGGSPPFGYRLQTIMKFEKGREVFSHSILVPDSMNGPILIRLFYKALDTGWGQTRLAKYLNADSSIPVELKPFIASTVGDWLDSIIYTGEIWFCDTSTDIVDDVRITERNAPEDILKVRDFCEPLIAREAWDRVQAMRNAHRRRKGCAADDNRKLIEPLAPGMTLTYLLTGLVRCGHCRRAMTPNSTKYVAVDGTERQYRFYVCPGYTGGICTNSKRVPEPWLREVVIGRLRERLFPDRQ